MLKKKSILLQMALILKQTILILLILILTQTILMMAEEVERRAVRLLLWLADNHSFGLIQLVCLTNFVTIIPLE